MGFMNYLTNYAETKELHSNQNLRTRYYRTKYTTLRDTIMNYAKEHEYFVKNIDEKHREIFLQTTKFHLIISIIQINPMETAVDVKVQTYKIVGLKKPERTILNLYAYLNKKLDFKGLSLHP